jgi:hypothetical protein
MWLLENKEFVDPEDYYGFIYLITNKITRKQYIGRKYFTKAAIRQVKGKKKRTRKQSDWIDYYGSSPGLLKDVELLGKENFERQILRLCKTRGETNYWEVRYQFEYKVLEIYNQDGEPLFYNDNVAMKFTRRNIGDKYNFATD